MNEYGIIQTRGFTNVIPWADIVRTLRDGGYTGWLSSGYEGRREPYRGREQVRRQHALLRALEAAP